MDKNNEKISLDQNNLSFREIQELSRINRCIICSKGLCNFSDEIITVKNEDLIAMTVISQSLNDGKWISWEGKRCMLIHGHCYKNYIDSRKQSNSSISEQSTHSDIDFASISNDELYNSELKFNYKKLCFFCCKSLNNKSKRINMINTMSEKIEKIIDLASLNEDENSSLIDRLNYIRDIKVTSYYHKVCYSFFHNKFRSNSSLDKQRNDLKTVKLVIDYIMTNNKRRFTLDEVKQLIKDNVVETEFLVAKLKEFYGNDMHVTKNFKEQPVFYLTTDMTPIDDDILSNATTDDDDLHKNQILQEAVQILRDEITCTTFSHNSYPPASKFLSNVTSVIPPRFKSFLDKLLLLMKEKDLKDDLLFVKRDALAHAIISIIKQKEFVSSLQLAIATCIRRESDSKLLIDVLSRLGLSASYTDLITYEDSTIMNWTQTKVESTFVQYVWDKTYNDPKSPVMKGIAIYTTFDLISASENKLNDGDHVPKFETSTELINQLPNVTIGTVVNRLDFIVFLSVDSLKINPVPLLQPHYTAYLYAKQFNIPSVPLWKEFMEHITRKRIYSVSHVAYLPIQNDLPENYDITNNVLQFAITETTKINQKTSIVTFDQPTYWKARAVIDDEKQILVRLGGFYLLTSYLKAIGFIMRGSGFELLWSKVYSPETTEKMLLGQALEKALRAHILSFTAIGMFMIQKLNPTNVSKKFIEKLFKTWPTWDESPTINDINEDMFMMHLNEELIRKIESIEKLSSTSKLWTQYLRLVTIVLQFIEADRLADWNLYLNSIRSMLPIFHATGDFEYAKSGQVFLQDLVQLKEKMNEKEFERFSKGGFFSIHQSEKSFSNLSPDMTEKPIFNQFFAHDLTVKDCTSDDDLFRYLQTKPTADNVIKCMKNYCNLESTTIDQPANPNKDKQIEEDNKDLKVFLSWFEKFDPYEMVNSTSNSTGKKTKLTINCHKALEQGEISMARIVGQNANSITFTKENVVIPF